MVPQTVSTPTLRNSRRVGHPHPRFFSKEQNLTVPDEGWGPAGAGSWRILRYHILPNSMAPLIVQLSFLFAYAVLSEATLSFLGLGAPAPTPTWGNIMAEGRQYMREAAWIIAIPGAALAITVMGLNLLGDGLRDVLDPRLKIQQ